MQSLASSKSVTDDSVLPELLGGGVWAQYYTVHYLNHWVYALCGGRTPGSSLDVANPCTLAPHRYFQSSLQLTTEQCKIISHPLRPGEAIQVKAFAGEPCSFPLVVRKHYYSLALKELWTELKDFSSNSVIASSIIKHGVDVYMGGVIFDFYTSHATGCLHIAILLYRYGWWWNKMVESKCRQSLWILGLSCQCFDHWVMTIGQLPAPIILL